MDTTIIVTATPTAINDLLNAKQSLMHAASDYTKQTKIRRALDEVTADIQHVVWSLMTEGQGRHYGDMWVLRSNLLIDWHANTLKSITAATVINSNPVVAEMLMATYMVVATSVTLAETVA